jgi:hypothetical protein
LPFGNYGYYVDQHPDLIEQPLDWSLDPDTGHLYFYAPEDFDLNRVTLSEFQSAFRWQVPENFGVFFEDLVFSQYTQAAINLIASFGGEEDRVIKVNNCEFRELLGFGLRLTGANGDSGVTHSTFENLYLGGAVYTASGIPSTLKIQNNRFSEIGLLPGYSINNLALQNQPSLQALILSATKNTLVKENVFREIGGRVISADEAENLLIEDNNFYDTQKHIASSGTIFSFGLNFPAKDWIIRRNTFCKGRANTKGNDPSHSPSGSYLYLNQLTEGLQVTDNLFIGNGELSSLMVSQHGVKNNHVSNNLFVGDKDYLIALSNYGAPYLETSDIEYSENRILQLNPNGSIYKIDYNFEDPPPVDSYRFFENTYYHYGTFHTRSTLHTGLGSSLLETDLRSLAIDSDQEAGSRSFNSLSTCQSGSQSVLLRDYEFPRDTSLFEVADHLTVLDQGSYLELTVPPFVEGSYLPLDWIEVSAGLPTYRIVYDVETNPNVPGHIKILENRKTQSADESFLSKWFGGYFLRQTFFHLITHKVEEMMAEFRPVLYLRNLSQTENYVAKLYGVQVFEYSGSCESNPWEDLAVLMNTTSESKNVSLHESYLDEDFQSVEEFGLPAHSYKLLFKKHLSSEHVIEIPAEAPSL